MARGIAGQQECVKGYVTVRTRKSIEMLFPWIVVALAFIAGGSWWYISSPHDLRLEAAEVARVSAFSELQYLPQQDHFVAKISFSSMEDFRKAMHENTFWGYGYLTRGILCNCD